MGEIQDLELLNDFFIECEEQILNFETGLLELEKNPTNNEALNKMFRCAHTIKGDSGYLGLKKIADFTHKFESFLSLFRDKKLIINSEYADLMFESINTLKQLVNAHKTNENINLDYKPILDKFTTIINSVSSSDQIKSPEEKKIIVNDVIINKNNKKESMEKVEEYSKENEISEDEYIIFNISKIDFGIRLLEVAEVSTSLKYSFIPYTPDFVVGIANLHSNIIPIIDLRIKFNLEMDNKKIKYIILKYKNSKVGIKVNEIKNILKIDKNRIKPVVSNFSLIDAEFLTGITKINNNLVLLANAEKLLKY